MSGIIGTFTDAVTDLRKVNGGPLTLELHKIFPKSGKYPEGLVSGEIVYE